MAYIYTPFMKKVLHITERKRKSNVHHYCKSDDLRAGFKVAKWEMFCHSAWLQISPARFKQVYSDSAINDIAAVLATKWNGGNVPILPVSARCSEWRYL